MTDQPSTTGKGSHPLARDEGWSLYSAAEAILKGVFEADTPVQLIAGPRRGSFEPVFAHGAEGETSALLARHGTALLATPDAARAVTLATHSAVSAHGALALVPNDELDRVIRALLEARRTDMDGAMCVVIEDDPAGTPASCPRQAAARLDMPCVEPAAVDQLRESIEHALRISRAVRGPVALVAHRWVLRSAVTLEARPNRVADPLTATGVRPRRRARWAETGDLLKVTRRLELNRIRTVPSPGELLPVGFIVVGPAAEAINHVVHLLALHGRVPVLELGLVHPLDESVVQRLLGRCREVVVLEPRPGSVAAAVLRAGESIRRRGEHSAAIGSVAVGPDDLAAQPRLEPDDALHPSVLARKIIGLLNAIRPGIELPFVPEPPELPAAPPPRGAGLGAEGALAQVRRLLADVDQWLHDQAPAEAGPETSNGAVSTALAIDGTEPRGPAGQRVVTVETWLHRRFMTDGFASLRQAALDELPWMFVVCGLGAEDAHDVQRLARAAIPAERSDGARVEVANLNDRQRLRALLRELTPACRLSVIVAADGPPPRFDVDALEQARREIDRLGYEPRQRLIQEAEAACAIRQSFDASRLEPPPEADAGPMRTQLTVGRLSRARRAGAIPRLRVRPLLEAVEVLRDRPPASPWRHGAAGGLELPRPLHAAQSQWRAHIAGFRGRNRGAAAAALCAAGEVMGYHVRRLHDPTPIGPGRRAWAQILFTRSRHDKGPPPLATRMPYGEADLLLGLDAAETLRAVDPGGSLRVANLDRTYAVVNLGPFADDTSAARPPVAAAVRAVSRDEQRMIEDFAAAARAVFHTDRVTDLMLLGAAFQRGLIPVSHEAMEAGLRRIEQAGYGRSQEAFRFGRQLAAGDRPHGHASAAAGAEDEQEDVEHVVRRMGLLLRCGRWGGRLDVTQFRELVRRTLAATPGLMETDPGRQARRDLVAALPRCLMWGGFEHARRYARLVTALYRADRGDTGRALTRCAILPLADAMLIRDPVYIATYLTSPGHRRRARQWLNVKLARGDRIHRRFLTRIELAAMGRRVRLDLRSSDWIAWIAAFARHRIPQRWRGTAHDREFRDALIDVIEQATRAGPRDYQRWVGILQRLHDEAADDRLRAMAVAELRMLVEQDEPPAG